MPTCGTPVVLRQRGDAAAAFDQVRQALSGGVDLVEVEGLFVEGKGQEKTPPVLQVVRAAISPGQ